MNKLSVVIITCNEQRNIGRCLESVKDIADDIVVIDALSYDKTEEICKEHNVNFISRKWTDYSDAKNFGNEKAKYDWILSIDADESLTYDLKNAIDDIKEKDKLLFCKFNRSTNYCGKWIRHSGWYPDTKLRMFDRRIAKWSGKIHETLVIDSQVKMHFLKGDLLHYSYYSIAEHLERMNSFTDAAAKELFEKGEKASICKIIFKTQIKFESTYFWKRGFLDGYYGIVIAVLSAMSEFVKFTKLRSFYQNSK